VAGESLRSTDTSDSKVCLVSNTDTPPTNVVTFKKHSFFQIIISVYVSVLVLSLCWFFIDNRYYWSNKQHTLCYHLFNTLIINHESNVTHSQSGGTYMKIVVLLLHYNSKAWYYCNVE